MADSTHFHLVVSDNGDYKKAFQDRDKASGYFDKLATAGKEVWLMLCSIKNNSMVLLRHYPGNSPVNGGADSMAPAPHVREVKLSTSVKSNLRHMWRH